MTYLLLPSSLLMSSAAVTASITVCNIQGLSDMFGHRQTSGNIIYKSCPISLVKVKSSLKGNDRSPESQQVFQNSSQVS